MGNVELNVYSVGSSRDFKPCITINGSRPETYSVVSLKTNVFFLSAKGLSRNLPRCQTRIDSAQLRHSTRVEIKLAGVNARVEGILT
jgi:hypothetical protein